jgi:hypothetical protein
MASPLLEEERDVLLCAAIAQAMDPCWVATAMVLAGLTTCDQPVDAIQVEPFERPKQRLCGDEPHS